MSNAIRWCLFTLLALIIGAIPGIAAAQGSWQAGNLPRSDISGGQFHYNYLQSNNYSSTGTKAALYIHEHEDTEGTAWYQGNKTEYLPSGSQADKWYNNATWLNAYGPVIVVLPYADQTCGDSRNCNFGGYGDSSGSQPNETAVAALAQWFIANKNVDPNRIYITGNSLGGIGAWALSLDYNAKNGTSGKIFAAALPFAGVIERGGLTSTNTQQVINGTPVWAVSGAGDTTSNVADWNQPLWRSIAGNSSYPAPPNGGQAGTSPYRYAQDSGLGHNVWDTWRPLPAGKPMYDWLFAQKANVAPPASGNFKISGGNIIAPNGSIWKGRGINIYDSQMSTVATNAAGQPLTSLFPNIAVVRLATYQYSPPSYYQAFVDRMTALGIVVEIEEHRGAGGSQGTIYTGKTLTDEQAWFTLIADAFKGNPLVWIGSYNEPPEWDGSNYNPAALASWQRTTYNTIRATGNTNIIFLEGMAPYADMTGQGAYFSAMTNIVWDQHFYGGQVGYQSGGPTDQTATINAFNAANATDQKLRSADGVVPAFTGEYGNAQNGTDIDSNWASVIVAVKNSAYGSTAWAWAPCGPPCNDILTNGSNALVQEGYDVLPIIAAGTPPISGAAAEALSVATLGTVAQNTAFTVSGSISGVTAAPTLQYQTSGGAWGALPSGASVSPTAFSFTHAAMSATTSATIGVRDANNTAVSAVSNTFIVAAPESANNTTVTTVGPMIVNSVGETWAISSGAQILVNGTADTTTSNVVELAYVNHVVWQLNTAGNWYNKTRASDTWGGPTTTSPITVTTPETITVNAVGQQQANVAFTVSGTLGGLTSAPTLQYQNNGGAWAALPGAASTTRLYYNQPGGNGSTWNTPIGSGATWGSASDADTIDISRGWNGSGYTAGPVGVINSTSNYGNVQYIGKSTDSTYAFSSSNNGRGGAATDNGGSLGATLHVPTGAYAPGPYPGDNGITLIDPVGAPGRQYTWGGLSQIQPPGVQPGQGPFSASAGEWDDATSDQYGEDADTGLAGYNVGAGMINACDVTASCNPDYPKIKHAWRYSIDAHLLKTNDTGDGYTLKPDSWPQHYQDGQSGINVYSGNLKAGTTLGIPSTTAMPSGLDANCQGAFWTMSHYPLYFRDQAGGGFHLAVDQVADTSAYIGSLRGCLPQLVKLLRPMRNQHQTGQSFASNPKNGPGTRLDSGPAPLSGTGGGGTVTATSFSFVNPGLPAGASNTVTIRDANNTSVTGTDGTFAVIAAATEALGVNTIGTQTAGVAFTVSGTVSGVTSPPGLQYQDGATGAWTALPTGATVSTSAFSFTHPGMAQTSSGQVNVRDISTTSIVAASNTFTVAAVVAETFIINQIPGQIANTAFPVSGTIANVVQPPTGGPVTKDQMTTWLAGLVGKGTMPMQQMLGQTGDTAGVTAVYNASGKWVAGLGGHYYNDDGSQTPVGGYAINTTAVNAALIPWWNAGGVVEVSGFFPNPSGGGYLTQGVDAAGIVTPGSATYIAWHKILDDTAVGLKQLLDAGVVPLFRPMPEMNGNWFFWGTGGLTDAQFNYVWQDMWNYYTNTKGLKNMVWVYSENGGSHAAGRYPGDAYVDVTGIDDYTSNPAGDASTMVGQLASHNKTQGLTEWGSNGPGGGVSIDEMTIINALRNTSLVFWLQWSTGWSIDHMTNLNVAMNDPWVLTRDKLNRPVASTTAPPASPPTMQYQDGSGPWAALPSGASVSTTAFSFTHPGMAAVASTTVGVRDANATAQSAISNNFAVRLQESADNTVVTTVGPTVVDATGEAFALTAGGGIAVGGVNDPTASNATALAYVNHTVWYENTSKLWSGKTAAASSWSTPTLTSPLPAETLAINAIGAQNANTAFTVSGTISAALTAPALQYNVSGGPWQSLPTGSTISTAAYSFVVPGIAAAGSATVGVRDAGTVSIAVISNTFQVAAAPVELLTLQAVAAQSVGVAFTVGGSISGVASAPTLQYNVSGGAWTALPAGAVVSSTAFSFTVPGIGAAGSATVAVRDSVTLISVVSNSFQVGVPASEAITLQPIANQVAGVAFGVGGSIANLSSAPTLQYNVSGGTWLALPSGAVVSATAFSFTVPGQSAAASATVAVRDAAHTSIVASSNAFQISAPTSETLSIAPIPAQPVGVGFTVSGTIGNLTAAPTLQYQDNGGVFQALPGGSVVTASSYSFTHPGMAAGLANVVTVRDQSHPSVTATAAAFAVVQRESANLTIITTIGPQITDATGTTYGITTGKQVAVNGAVSAGTSQVIELAYINRSLWYEDAGLLWYQRTAAGGWTPPGGTTLGPVPSSTAALYLTHTAKLAVVNGYTIAVPGIVATDTVSGGGFQVAIGANGGTLTMPGARGSRTAYVTLSGPLAQINTALAQLQFTGNRIGVATITVLLTDPAGVSATARVNVTVTRPAAVIQPGR